MINDNNTEKYVIKVMEVSNRTRVGFIIYRGSIYALYALIGSWMLNGSSGFLVEWLVSTGIEFISMSTFGTMFIGLGLLIGINLIQRSIDSLFEFQLGLQTKKKKNRWHRR